LLPATALFGHAVVTACHNQASWYSTVLQQCCVLVKLRRLQFYMGLITVHADHTRVSA
jgi:hypothetical protein